ncbi:MAG: phosphoribosylanthranilate isomerase [Acidobacteriota bacterium]|nr:phosphoribosylanthranilate isomerase [Acidobacteriota bacterium]
MWVKICGTTNVDDALLAAASGADAVGFVFAPSSRQVTAQQVAEITPRLPTEIEKIAVFTVQDAEQILGAVALAGLTGVQLHGAFNPALIAALKDGTGVRVLQVVSFAVEGGAEAERRFEEVLRNVLAEPQVDAVLLDTAKGGISGGTGVTFNWTQAAEILRRVWPQESHSRLIVAGGLGPDNVAAAIAQLQPWGVDVVSGVEASPGKKDPARVRDFIDAARHS